MVSVQEDDASSSAPDGDSLAGPKSALPPKPTSGLALVAVGVVATVSGFWSILAIANLFTTSNSTRDYVVNSIMLVIGLTALGSAWLAWRVGGYPSLVNADKRALVKRAEQKFYGVVHSIGEFMMILSGLAAAVLVAMAGMTVNTPIPLRGMRIVAGVAAALFVTGLLVTRFTRTNKVAISARIENLWHTVNGLSTYTESTRRALARAADELEDIERRIGTELRHLSKDREAVDRLTEFLDGDPQAVASLQKQRRKEGLQAALHTWVAFMVGVIVTLALAIYPPDPIKDWLRAHVRW